MFSIRSVQTFPTKTSFHKPIPTFGINIRSCSTGGLINTSNGGLIDASNVGHQKRIVRQMQMGRYDVLKSFTNIDANILDNIKPERQRDFFLNSGDVASHFLDNIDNLNKVGDYGSTFLHKLCYYAPKNGTELVSTALKNGALIDAVNKIGETPLHIACRTNKDMALQLMKAGADVEARNSHGERPIHIACEVGHEDVIKGLMDEGAGLNYKREKYHETPLNILQRRGYPFNQLLYGGWEEVGEDEFGDPL